MSGPYTEASQANEKGVSEGIYLLAKNQLNGLKAVKDESGKTVQSVQSQQRELLRGMGGLTAKQKNILDDLLVNDVMVIPQDVKADYSTDATLALSQSSDKIQKGWASVEKTGVKYDAYLSYADKLAEIAKGHEGDGDAALKREALFKDKSLTPAQKSALDTALVGDLKNKIDYTNEETYTISQMTPAAQLDWKDAKARNMKVADFAKYYPIATKSGTTKAERINSLVKAGLTRDRADAFYALVHKKR